MILPAKALRNQARFSPSLSLCERVRGAIVTDFGTDSMSQEIIEYKCKSPGEARSGIVAVLDGFDRRHQAIILAVAVCLGRVVVVETSQHHGPEVPTAVQMNE